MRTVSFYSKLVRLKVGLMMLFILLLLSFYSKLVRLKEFIIPHDLHRINEVSIPNWFD